MKRTFVSVTLLVAISLSVSAAAVAAEAIWVPINGTATPQRPSVTVLGSNETETIIQFNTPGFWSESVIEGDEEFQLLKIPGYASTQDIGKAMMPTASELVAIPGSASVRVEILDFEEVSLPGYRVYPYQTPLLETEVRSRFDIDRSFYARSEIYPEQLAGAGDPGIWRDLRVVNLKVHPLQFNPATGEIKGYSEITVRLVYEGVSNVNVKPPQTRPIASNYDRMYRKAVLNYDHLHFGSLDAIDADYDYLIIADDNYVDDMTPFINWKTAQGLATNIVSISEVGNNSTSIKNYIDTEYTTNGIRYVLLVGDESDVVGYTGYGTFSDYWYALLEGSDYYAELAIGRFSVSNATELGYMIDKSVTFESNPPAGDWLEKSLLVAHREYAPDKYQGCKEEIRTAAETASGTYEVLYPNFTTAYGASTSVGGDAATNADVIAYINEGQRVVNYRGHGMHTTWSTWNIDYENFTPSDVADIDNGEMTPVVFGMACYNGDLLYSTPCLAEAFTREEDAAVAYLGASNPSYTLANHVTDKQLYAAIFDEGINAIGDASNEAFVRTIVAEGYYGELNARMYIWLGDPSLQVIYQGSPGPPAPALVYPDDGAYFDDPAQPTLDWSDVAEAISYHVQIDNDSNFSSPVGEQEGLTASEWTTPELGLDLYFWRVRSADAERYGVWSEVRTIFVGIQAEAPLLISPADGAKLRNASGLELTWGELTGVFGYYVEIDDSSDFSSPDQEGYSDDCTGGVCVYEISPRLEGGTWYWRVRAENEGWPWSDVWSFKLQGSSRRE
jgi:hypothetical protein